MTGYYLMVEVGEIIPGYHNILDAQDDQCPMCGLLQSRTEEVALDLSATAADRFSDDDLEDVDSATEQWKRHIATWHGFNGLPKAFSVTTDDHLELDDLAEMLGECGAEADSYLPGYLRKIFSLPLTAGSCEQPSAVVHGTDVEETQ